MAYIDNPFIGQTIKVGGTTKQWNGYAWVNITNGNHETRIRALEEARIIVHRKDMGEDPAVNRQKIQAAFDLGASTGVPVELVGSKEVLVNRAGATNAWAIKLPTNLTLYASKRFILKLAPNQLDFTRVVSAADSEDVSVFGDLIIDGSHLDQDPNIAGEHMHGFFTYKTKRLYVQRLTSYNCYADNVTISGLDNSVDNYSDDIVIDYISGKTAGRKCLVLEACDNVRLGTVLLDNRLGEEAGGAWNGGNCVDIEPFSLAANGRKMNITIDKLVTHGMGDDFTTGTTNVIANTFGVQINDYTAYLMDNAASKFVMYGLRLNVGKWRIIGSDGTTYGNIVEATFGNEVVVGEMEIHADTSGYQLRLAQSGGDQPNWNIGKLKSRGAGSFIEHVSAKVKIETLDVERDSSNTSDLGVVTPNSTGLRGSLMIDNLVAYNINNLTMSQLVGSAYNDVSVDNLIWTDERSVGRSFFVFGVGDKKHNENTKVGYWSIPASNFVVGATGAGSDFFKQGTYSYYKESGTPESVIDALAGSTCQIPSVGLYKKTGGGVTGWVAL